MNISDINQDLDYIESIYTSRTTLFIWGIFALLIIIVMIILLVRLRKNMDIADLNNVRINQYLAAIPEHKIGNVQAIYDNSKKELGMALLLAFLLGSFGVHKIYLGKRKGAILYFLFFWTLIPSLLALFDAVNMPKTVSEYNLIIVQNLYNQLAAPLAGEN